MTFKKSGINFIILITFAFVLLGIDAYFFANGQETFSETIWYINQKTLAIAFGVGIVCGHLFTVPK